MNLYEFAETFDISLAKARKMHKKHLLLIDEADDPLADEIRFHLAKGQPLFSPHLLALVEDPKLAFRLGSYREKAQAQVQALGGAKAEAAPPEIAALIFAVAGKDKDCMIPFIGWIKRILPRAPVTHPYIAVRLALGLPPETREGRMRTIAKALQNCREHPNFAGWWTSKEAYSRKKILYHQAKAPFDL